MSSEEQLDLNPQPLDQRTEDELDKRLAANRCPRCDIDLSFIKDDDGIRRYCMNCRMTIVDVEQKPDLSTGGTGGD
jgi:uncharacterized paraquat-inducible protein A